MLLGFVGCCWVLLGVAIGFLGLGVEAPARWFRVKFSEVGSMGQGVSSGSGFRVQGFGFRL